VAIKTIDDIQDRLAGVPESLSEWDDELAKIIRSHPNKALDRYFTVFRLLGKEPTTFSLAVLTFGFLFKRKQIAAAWAVVLAVGGSWLINQILKRTMKRPRPLSLNTLRRHANTYSFPSAHANLAMCYYGFLAWLGLKFFKNPLARAIWALLMLYFILMIGVSRVYDKEHHPTDVLSSYAIGGVWLTILLIVTSRFEGKQEEQKG
jgi:undecaprenyl-diphosphatase